MRLNKKADTVNEILENEVSSLIEKRLPELVAEYGIPNDYNMQKRSPCYSFMKDERGYSKACLEARAEARRNEEARRKAISDILFILELGGTKADLDKMLLELKK